jgi:hypothetical protein
MSAPKHLWSGDWEDDSAEASRERARRRGQLPPPPPEPERPVAVAPLPPRREPPPHREPPPEPPRPSAPPRERTPLPRPRTATVLITLLAVLVLAGAAYGLSALGGSGGTPVATVAKNTPWLGFNMETLPVNRVMIVAVTPGSPADRAGLGPGDVLISVNSHPIASPGDVTAVISQLHPGDRVAIVVQRGPLTYSTKVTVAAQPAGYP